MAKCYVIKNKDGKYFGYYDSEYNKMEFSNKPQRFIMFNTFRNAKKIKNFWKMKDCEVVECNICEGNIEEELEVLRRAYYNACNELYNITGNCAYDHYEKPLPDYCDEQCFIETHNCLCWDRYFIDQAREEIEREKKDE